MPDISFEKEQHSSIDQELESLLQKQSARIKVVGCGGGGGNSVSRMKEVGVKGCEVIALNTDAQDLLYTTVDHKILIGRELTHGLGAGSNPKVGEEAARESETEIKKRISNSDMVFITCGLGGGTGTGASPMIASIAREMGALTVAVVTKPFSFEGAQRKDLADKGFEELRDKVDTIITVQNDRLLQIIDKKTSLLDAFSRCDEVLQQGVQGIAELITIPGLVNVDFADVKSIMSETGSALMGIGIGEGENRTIDAAKQAISSPLLDMNIEGARGILFTVTGGKNLGMHEVNEAAKIITASADPNAKIIFGANIDESMKDEVKITVVATGFNENVRSNAPEEVSAEKSSYRPSQFLQKERISEMDRLQERPAEEKEDVKNRADDIFGQSDDPDLDVPAFIRKKIKK